MTAPAPGNMFNLAGRTTLVTGSSRGLGRAIAEGLAVAGARVFVNGTNEARVAETVAELRKAGHRADAAVFNITDEKAVTSAFDAFDKAGVDIDILVNNAGIQLRKPMIELSTDEWRSVMETNLTSAFVVGREAAKRMIPRGRGKVINIGSLTSALATAWFTRSWMSNAIWPDLRTRLRWTSDLSARITAAEIADTAVPSVSSWLAMAAMMGMRSAPGTESRRAWYVRTAPV